MSCQSKILACTYNFIQAPISTVRMLVEVIAPHSVACMIEECDASLQSIASAILRKRETMEDLTESIKSPQRSQSPERNILLIEGCIPDGVRIGVMTSMRVRGSQSYYCQRAPSAASMSEAA